ncbi:MAG: DUF4845 domain-containing protein [Hahellaceae bacterium]|jgi:pyruvate/oxaloacetate carboxyltransferase|nr:DUF4845 domain-containing protein [Hahellaceae bacterium]MCP5212374.1 DUF4845 domain-containing protein [Hahellaceae bacterium]
MTKKNQAGGSTIATLFLLIMVALALTLAIKILPKYMDNNSINSVINAMVEDSQVTSYTDDQIFTKIQSRLIINNIRDFKNESIKIKRDNGLLTIDADYEVRENIFKNVDVVVSFTNHAETPLKDN